MKINKLLILIILAASTLTTYAQLSVDIFYGYNHSNKESVMPSAYNSVNYQTFYSDNPIDTIVNIHYPDTTTRIVYELRSYVRDEEYTYHNFAIKPNLNIWRCTSMFFPGFLNHTPYYIWVFL